MKFGFRTQKLLDSAFSVDGRGHEILLGVCPGRSQKGLWSAMIHPLMSTRTVMEITLCDVQAPRRLAWSIFLCVHRERFQQQLRRGEEHAHLRPSAVSSGTLLTEFLINSEMVTS